jgi:hypothetical protein|tara:strand:+ start:696 stop:3977 length:3282 start_codon:yes stop_codon:yes gene_type:complete
MEETIVVECSRQSSVEGTSNNYTSLAEWTCDCGSGIVLDIGDKIQVHSGFVSEKGAQAGEIEIKERVRGDTVTVNVSKEIDYRYPFPFPDPGLGDVITSKEIYSHQVELGGNEDVPVTINDGKTNFIYSPYLTTNGEFYASLPRRHCGWNASITATALTPWEEWDSHTGVVGNVIHGPLDGGERETNVNFIDAWQFCPADYYLPILAHNDGALIKKGMIRNDNSRYTLFRAKSVYRSASSAAAVGGEKRALLGGAATDTSDAPGTTGYQDAVDLRDPAILYDYDQVKNLVELSSKKGFNKPQDVAVELTQQLNLRGEAQELSIYHLANTKAPNPDEFIKQVLYKYYESPCFKAYNCAGTAAFKASDWDAFRKVQSTTDADLDSAHLYMSQYQHIGVKRPDLFIQGRETNGAQGFLKSNEGDAANTPQNSQVLNLGLEWTQPNLDKLNKLFNVQAKYDELFTGIYQQGPMNASTTYYDIEPNKHRFIHFNKQDEWTTTANNASGYYRHNPKASLGYDLYGIREGDSKPTSEFYQYDRTMATYPIFFDYNPDTANFNINDVGYCEDAGGGTSDINDLAYGWARKVRKESSISQSGVDVFYIGIQFTHTGNGVPYFLYNGLSHIALTTNGSGTGVPGGRRFGWDHHFSAYGNACILPYSGMVENDAAGIKPQGCTDFKEHFVVATSAFGLAPEIRSAGAAYNKIFLGGDEPAIGFDENEERFFISNLHMGEPIGNPSDAGAIAIVNASGVTTTAAVDPNSNADNPCYKINKRMLGTSYCPNVAPYTPLPKAGSVSTKVYPNQIAFSNNLEAFTPYDSQGGMFIEQVAVPENIWSENLFGVLGFDYSQFNNTDISRQVSIKDRFNATNMKFLTTQAPIAVEDMIGWTKNGFGNSIELITPGPSYVRKEFDKPESNPAETDTSCYANLLPAATVVLPSTNTSTKIVALDLPTKTARPYYAIRSDIIPQSQFVGGNADLPEKSGAAAVNRPVVAVVNKINGYGDFYSSESQQLIFTNTQKRVITQIKTSVHDPDGSYAKVNKSSSVIYKIIKQRNIDLTPVQTYLESKNKQQQLLAQQATSMLIDPANANPNYKYAFNN